MKLTLKKKREIVLAFIDKTWSVSQIACGVLGSVHPLMAHDREPVEETLRDFINGKFKLKPQGPPHSGVPRDCPACNARRQRKDKHARPGEW